MNELPPAEATLITAYRSTRSAGQRTSSGGCQNEPKSHALRSRRPLCSGGVDVELIPDNDAWGPYLSMDDAGTCLHEFKEAFRDFASLLHLADPDLLGITKAVTTLR